ncbi:MAG: ribonuclease P protein component [Clostridiales bacterium]|nr:ribonuclease P protein component [Clostridiales bacterium]
MKALPLRFNYEFSRVYRRAAFATGRYMTVHVFRRPKGLKHNNTRIPEDILRVGFCASKKQMGAVGRNKARRLMREAYRHLEPRIREGNDIVITLKFVDELPSYAEIRREMEVLLSRLKVLKAGACDDEKSVDQDREVLSEEHIT